MFDFKANTWFEQYLAFRRQHPLALKEERPLSAIIEPEAAARFESLRHPLYLCLQHSGMLYGFPIHYPFKLSVPAIGKLPAPYLAKLILLDTIMYAIWLEEGRPEGEAYTRLVASVGASLSTYYRQLHEHGLGQPVEYLEDALFYRARYKKNQLDFRHTGINSHLFWDLYFFRMYYRRPQQEANDVAYFRQLARRKRDMRTLALKVAVAAVHADWRLVRQEKRLLRQFRRSARLLDAAERQQVRTFFKWGLSLDDIQFPELDWIARRYLMDISLLAIYADTEIDLQEDSFIRQLALRLQLDEGDLLGSKADLGSFLYLHGKRLNFYDAKRAGLLLLGQAVYENMLKLGYAARMEAVETRNMALTFGRLLAAKLRLNGNGELPTEQEITEAIEQLKDIPRFLPFFSLIFMPVPGITEMYIVLAFSLEKLSGGTISLLPSQIRKAIGRKQEE
ncbi:MAG: hypothetical protein KDC66_07275 [Phaeodactylibacter sp.]|nr:hypothetical protein [Phaeodactylibacter sp.]MCB9275080.1 hypothetical protein [Lewinellaceae bacterium]